MFQVYFIKIQGSQNMEIQYFELVSTRNNDAKIWMAL